MPRAVLVGKTDDDFFPKEVAELFRTQDAEVMNRREMIEYEETIPLPGGVRSFITEKFPLFDANGKISAVGGFCTEITSQLDRADESLAAERERLAVTVRSIAEGLVATDTLGRVILLNPTAENFAGTKSESLAGRTIEDVFSAADTQERAALAKLVGEVLSAPGDEHLTPSSRGLTLTTPTSGKRDIVATSAAVRDRQGKHIGAVLSLRDVTEQRRLDAERFKMRSLESLGFLAGGIAHDFNNLLGGIIGNLGLILDEPSLPKEARDSLEEISRICARATALSRQLLTFAGGGSPARAPIDLPSLLQDTARLVLRSTCVHFHLSAPPGVSRVLGDDAQLTQVFGNLFVNSKDAMPSGGGIWASLENHDLTVPLLHLAPGRYVRAVVRDDGPGIPPEILPHIFDPYFSSKKSGSGLGLAIVHSVLKRHGGHIWTESSPGSGAHFVILLPATDQRPEARAGAAPARRAPSGSSALIMDDEPSILAAARRILSGAGYIVETASEGKQALAAYKRSRKNGRPFSVIILDLTIRGGMGGVEAARRILSLDERAPVILSSGYSEEIMSAAASRVGKLPMLRKPYTREQLLQATARASRRRRVPKK